MPDYLVVIRGGGDLGSGIALRLWRIGFPVLVLESAQPLAVRRTVSFAEAVYDGSCDVEEARGVLLETVDSPRQISRHGSVGVLVDPAAESVRRLGPFAVVDAIMAKRNTGTSKQMAKAVVCAGPGFVAGHDCHAVVETNRSPDLGRVFWSGSAEADTGVPGEIGGATARRVLRAPSTGTVRSTLAIGDIVQQGSVIGLVGSDEIRAPFDGVIRGLVRNGVTVPKGVKIGDIDPRGRRDLCYKVSDKSLAVAGGVMEAILMTIAKERA